MSLEMLAFWFALSCALAGIAWSAYQIAARIDRWWVRWRIAREREARHAEYVAWRPLGQQQALRRKQLDAIARIKEESG